SLTLASNVSRVTATGQVTTKGEGSDLRVSLNSSDARELQTIAYSISGVKDAVTDYQPSLSGEFRFEGRVSGSLSDPSIEGDLNAFSVGLRDETVGGVTGHLRFSPQVVAFENGVLAATDGGTAHFSYSAPRAEVSSAGRLDATIDGIKAETIAP